VADPGEGGAKVDVANFREGVMLVEIDLVIVVERVREGVADAILGGAAMGGDGERNCEGEFVADPGVGTPGKEDSFWEGEIVDETDLHLVVDLV